MQRLMMVALATGACAMILPAGEASAQFAPNGYGAPVQAQPVSTPYRQGDMGGGFIEFLFSGAQPRAPRYPDSGGMPAMQPPVMSQPEMQMQMQQQQPQYAPAYARFGGGRSGGRFDTLELAATFPDFRPAGDSVTPLAEADGSGKSALVFFTFARADRKADPADMVGMLYARFLEPRVEETEEGLIRRAFQDGSPYQGEDLYFAPPEGRAFAARCARPTVPSDGLPETCLSLFREGGLDVSIRFGRPLLARWERLAGGARALAQTMIAR